MKQGLKSRTADDFRASRRAEREAAKTAPYCNADNNESHSAARLPIR